MRLKTRFRLFAAIASGISLMLVGIAAWQGIQARQSFENQTRVQNIVSATLRMEIFTAEYKHTGLERPRVQWLASHADVGHVLRELMANTDAQADLKHSMVNLHRSAGRLFRDLENNHGTPGSKSDSQNHRWLQRLHGQLSAELVALAEQASRLIRLYRNQTEGLVRAVSLIGSTTGVIALLGWVGFLLMTNPVVLTPVARLTEATVRLREGNLEHRVRTSGDEEIAELARSFNAMAGQLNQMTLELRASEERYRLLVENSPMSILVHRDDRLVFINPAARNTLGGDEADLIGTPIWQIVHPDFHDIESKRMASVYGKIGPAPAHEERFIRNDGSVIDVEVMEVLVDFQGVPACQMGFTNITERKQAEERLKDSERRFRTLATLSPVGIFRNNAEGDCIYANEKAGEIAGLPVRQCLGHGWANNLHPEDRARVQSKWLLTRQAHTHFREQYRFKHADGRSIWVIGEVTTEREETGEVTGFIGTITDTTQYKQIEQALQKSEKNLVDAQRIAHLGSWAWDIKSGHEVWSDEQFRIFGYRPNQIQPTYNAFLEALHSEDRERVLEAVRCVLDGSRPYREEFRIVRPDGTIRYIDAQGEVQRHADGRPIRMVGTILDISERKRAELEQIRLLAYLDNVIDSMPSVLIGIDPQGRVTQWNREAEKVTTLTGDRAKGRPFGELFPSLADQTDTIRHSIMERRTHKIHGLLIEVADEAHYTDVTVFPLIMNGVTGGVIRIDDVTERVRLEEMMVQTEKMMSLGGLSAGMAHEINNPLGGILQGIQNVERRLSDTLQRNQQVAMETGLELSALQSYLEKRQVPQLLDDMRQSGKRAADIVANMLHFSRQADKKKQEARLDELIERAIMLASVDYDLKKKFDFRSIQIVRDYHKDLPPVPCQAAEIEQVLLNLFSNAAQAMSNYNNSNEPSRITVRTRLYDSRVASLGRGQRSGHGRGHPPSGI